jgi:hypothetical protein
MHYWLRVWILMVKWTLWTRRWKNSYLESWEDFGVVQGYRNILDPLSGNNIIYPFKKQRLIQEIT